MAIKTISQFPSGTPADNDYILFEKNGEGKSAKFSDFSLSYEEIMATNPVPDLSGKVASASAVNTFANRLNNILSKFLYVNGSKTITLNLPYGSIFMGIMATRTTLVNGYSLYLITGYHQGLGRYNVVPISTESNNPISNIDANSTEQKIMITTNTTSYVTILWLYGGDNITYEVQ